MIIAKFVVKKTGFAAKLKQAQWNRVLKAGFQAAGTYWHINYLPGHFTEAGGKKYGYKKRSGEREGLAALKDARTREDLEKIAKEKGYKPGWVNAVLRSKKKNAVLRSSYYQKKKRHAEKKGLPFAPLVWSGESMNAAKKRNVKATSKGARVVLNVPNLNFQQNRDEVTRVTRDEARTLRRVFRDTVTDLLKWIQNSETTTIGK